MKTVHWNVHEVTQANADSYSEVVLQIETLLANYSLSPEEERNIQALYNMMSTQNLQDMTPQLDWAQYFTNLHVPSFDSLNVAMPGFFLSKSFLWFRD